MNPNDVIESYVVDVVRRVPVKERNDIGVELRELLDGDAGRTCGSLGPRARRCDGA